LCPATYCPILWGIEAVTGFVAIFIGRAKYTMIDRSENVGQSDQLQSSLVLAQSSSFAKKSATYNHSENLVE
jgi:hypothetical protein